MTNGLIRNTARLFDNGGKLFVLAMDRGQAGAVPGLEDVVGKMEATAKSELDGYLVNLGPARKMAEGELVNKKLLLRTSFGGSAFCGEYLPGHYNFITPENALALGADAVVMMMSIGEGDAENIQHAATAIDTYHSFGIPVIVEILSMDFENTATYDVQLNGARIASELGADVVKAFFTENFDTVVSNCLCPVMLAGGPKGSDIYETAAAAVKAGVKGFAFGRNLFQADDMAERISKFNAILRG